MQLKAYFCDLIKVFRNILLIGSGGREHTLAWKMAQSNLCSHLFIAPGNPGTARLGTNVNLKADDISSIKSFCLDHQIELVVVGPEAPLVEGLTDALRAEDTRHIGVIGPSAQGALLEGSKAFAKKFMQKYDIPTAAYLEVSSENLDEGLLFLSSMSSPYVLKADGLAAGKGVLIIDDLATAQNELKAMLNGKFGNASATVVIEQFLSGIEFSVFVLTDGKDYMLLPEAKDYKRIGEGDTGLNTGGMGAVSPVPFVDATLWDKVIEKVVKPTIHGIRQEQMDYVGFVFFGLINVGGDPYVIEYNCRMGDPETEVVIPRIKSDLVALMQDAVSGQLSGASIEVDDQAAATVMLVSGGYPGAIAKGKAIYGLENVSDSIVFHAGTAEQEDQLVTSGGRVMAVTSLDKDFREAIKKSIENAEKIHFDGKYFRRDIGFDL
ncbi:MAG: phosphoribosylamine--glycine ligase [Chitinophagales bacterium]|nr:phosphoribosylamine--glycine ligase [Chitinophagales bacterium]